MTTLEPPIGKEPWKRVRKRKGKPSIHDIREDNVRDTQPMTVRCMFCDWHTQGPAGQARLEALRHRRQKHRRRRRK